MAHQVISDWPVSDIGKSSLSLTQPEFKVRHVYDLLKCDQGWLV